jgi:hypothetical protein
VGGKTGVRLVVPSWTPLKARLDATQSVSPIIVVNLDGGLRSSGILRV